MKIIKNIIANLKGDSSMYKFMVLAMMWRVKVLVNKANENPSERIYRKCDAAEEKLIHYAKKHKITQI